MAKLRFGRVTEIDAAKGTARVQFEEDEIVSAPLRVGVSKAHKDSYTFAYDVGEYVACLMDENSEQGVITSAVYAGDNQPRNGGADIAGVTFSDGTKVHYDRAAHSLVIEVAGGDITIRTTKDVKIECVNASVTASGKTTLDTPQAEVTGDLKVGGNLQIAGSTSGTGDFSTSGNFVVNGDSQIGGRLDVTQAITSDAEVSAAGGAVNLTTHIHPTPSGPSGTGAG